MTILTAQCLGLHAVAAKKTGAELAQGCRRV